MAEQKVSKVTVVGSGSWGMGICGLLAHHAKSVVVWSHEEEVATSINACHKNPLQLKDYTLPDNVYATNSYEEALRDTEAVVVVVPSAFLRATCKGFAPYVDEYVPILVLTKGVEQKTSCLMADVVAQEVGKPSRIAVLSGPNHAEEVSQDKISCAVVAAESQEIAEFFQSLVMTHTFRVYVTDDVVGVEVCAAAKNVIAVAAGIAYALGAGDNTLAALMTRGLAEVSRIAVALGADPLTCMGLAGMGDLIVTCTSRHSRNRTFGEAFVAGESLADYQKRTGMVVEGAEAAKSILQLAEKKGIQVPITRVVHDILYRDMDLHEAIDALMGRYAYDEFYDVR